MTLQIKICGLSTEETIDVCVAERVDYIGFVFYPRSPRAVSAARAADLGQRIPRPIKKCGLFVDETNDVILRTAEQASLDLLQLHGDEDPERCAWLRERSGLPVMKAFGVRADQDIQRASRWFGAVDLLLFDAKPPAQPTALPGGNGVTFDWSLLEGRAFPLPWLLSGGLTPDNIGDALRRVRPSGVDVSSGVELSPGIKDKALIHAFIRAARAAA